MVTRDLAFRTHIYRFTIQCSVPQALHPTSIRPLIAPLPLEPGPYNERLPQKPLVSLAAPPLTPTESTWWLWPNLLSADATLVAVLWALLFAMDRNVPIPWPVLACMGLTVWSIYAADHLLDGKRRRNPQALRLRHLFCKRTAFGHFLSIGIAASLLFVAAARFLPGTILLPGAILGLAVVAYLFLVHRSSIFDEVPYLKESSVGILFATGVTLPLWAGPHSLTRTDLFSWVMFGALCAMNCIAIDFWELPSDQPGSHRKEKITELLLVLFATIAWLAIRLPGYPLPEKGAIALAAVLLLLLHNSRARFSTSALRVLADVALFVPVLFVLIAKFMALRLS